LVSFRHFALAVVVVTELIPALCVYGFSLVRIRFSRPWITFNFCPNLPRSVRAGRTVDLWSCRIACLWGRLRRRQRREDLPLRLRQRSRHAADFGSAGRAKPARRALSPANGGLLDRSPMRCRTFHAAIWSNITMASPTGRCGRSVIIVSISPICRNATPPLISG
jgi:hypothetical protein